MLKRLLVTLLCLLTSYCTFNFGGTHTTESASTPVVVQKESQNFDINTTFGSVVKILVRDKKGIEFLSGTGFAIDKDKIMTAGHVCDGIIKFQKAKKITKKIYMDFYATDGETILETSGLKILSIDKQYDICIMQKKLHGLVPIKFIQDYSSIKLHSVVYIVGAPLGVFATAYQGLVVIKDDGSDMHYLIVDAASAPGNSGSPVFDENGEVIGIFVAGPGNFDHLSVCVPSYLLIKFVAKVK